MFSMLEQQMKIQVSYVGNEKQPVVIVDNFLAQAEKLIDYALQAGGVAQDPGYYPGLRALAPARYSDLLLEFARTTLADYFTPFTTPLNNCESYFSMVTTPAERLTAIQSVPHFDRPNMQDIAAIHYLCGEKQGGTSLYRHKKSGYEYIDSTRVEQYLLDLQCEIEQSDTTPQGYINGDSALFERIHSVDAQFNRILFYRCSSLHSGNIGLDYDYDSHPQTGRFTMTSFLRS